MACVLITHLRAKAEMQRRPHLKSQPVVIVDRGKSGAVVAAGMLLVADTLLRRAYARPVMRDRYASRAVGEDGQLPGGRGLLGEGLLHRPQQAGGGTAGGSCGRPSPDSVRVHGRVGGALGSERAAGQSR